MNRAEAIENLKSNNASERFRAALTLSRYGTADDVRLLRQAKRIEKDAFVIKRLDYAISVLNRNSSIQISEDDFAPSSETNSEVLKIARTQAIDWVSGLLLHEISSKLGLLSVSVKKEIENYNESLTKRNIQNLQSVVDSIAALRTAAVSAQYEQFDLSELISECVATEGENSRVSFEQIGLRPLLIRSSKKLINLALNNGIRNAIEAEKAAADSTVEEYIGRVIITWGMTDKDYWISILDDGVGLSDAPKSMFDVGKTSKKGHPGFGLAIAKQAMDTLDGTLSLAPYSGRGAKYEMRWRIST